MHGLSQTMNEVSRVSMKKHALFLVLLLLSACALNDVDEPSVTRDALGLPMPTSTLNPTPPGYPGNPVTHNMEWTPITQTFNQVEMVLVPAGCFQMGTVPGGFGEEDETPPSSQCFQDFFWLDKYEVTNEQFDRIGEETKLPSTWKDPLRPRETILWREARDFCLKRGGRLPTEREWEYAARGPDVLTYPWGNVWLPDNLVYPANADQQTAEVGSRPGGISWVGVFDMAGNVWEWTSTLYDQFHYPYDAFDGRENQNDITSKRVIRGTSWYDGSDFYSRTANRGYLGATIEDFNIGFRCARDFHPGDPITNAS